MKRIFLRLKQPLRNERGEITFFACFFVVGIVMLISFLLLYASIRITCINIRNGAKMELEAYPIIVFTKQLEDRSRKIMEIIEGEDYQDGRLIAHSLYKYEVEDNVTDDRGETRVVGHHKKIGLISDSLKKRLLDNGISNKELEEFMQPPKEVS